MAKVISRIVGLVIKGSSKWPNCCYLASIALTVIFISSTFMMIIKVHLGSEQALQQLQPLKSHFMMPNNVFNDNWNKTDKEIWRYRIPPILHQKWMTEYVPIETKTWISSWNKLHPEWKYWFWTDKSVFDFLQESFPDFTDLYKGYKQDIQRADVMRYFVLYQFGGVYADLDFEWLRSLDEDILNRTCFIAQEPLEHALLINEKKNFDRPFGTNALMGCRRKHPFFKYVIERLKDKATLSGEQETTGPWMVDSLAQEYIKQTKYSKDEDKLFLAPPKYFLPRSDPRIFGVFIDECLVLKMSHEDGNGISNKREKMRKNLCKDLLKLGYEKYHAVPSDSYSDHKWQHSYMQSYYVRGKSKNNIHINQLVPQATVVAFN